MFPQVVQRQIVREGGKLHQDLVAYPLSNISAKNCQNWLTNI